jgi:hypothetical protein
MPQILWHVLPVKIHLVPQVHPHAEMGVQSIPRRLHMLAPCFWYLEEEVMSGDSIAEVDVLLKCITRKDVIEPLVLENCAAKRHAETSHAFESYDVRGVTYLFAKETGPHPREVISVASA